jgi:hypothetical protein
MERSLQYYTEVNFKSINDKTFVKCKQLSEELIKLAIEDQRYRTAIETARRQCKYLKAGFDFIKDD